MNNIKTISFFIILLFLGISLTAQDSSGETINVPLSNPSSSGILIANSHKGTITVEGYSGNEVVVTMSSKKSNYGKSKDKNKYGMKKISTGFVEVEITEDNNVVKISTGTQNHVNLEIKVPYNFDLKIGTHHDGQVKIKDVEGQLEVSAHHGGIEMINIKGSAVADTHHGAIIATFARIDSDKAMGFTTYHGDVDISFPKNLRCETKIKTTKGDIYTDFEMIVTPQKPSRESTKGSTKIKLGGWVHGNIGSGGPEYMFSTYHGDVILREFK